MADTVIVAGRISESLEPLKIRLRTFQEREQLQTKRGEAFPYKVFEELLDLPRRNGRYQAAMSWFRKQLLESHGVELVTMMNKGYAVAMPGQQVCHIPSEQKRASRRIRKSVALATGALMANDLKPNEKMAAEHAVLIGGQVVATIEDSRRFVMRRVSVPALPNTGTDHKG